MVLSVVLLEHSVPVGVASAAPGAPVAAVGLSPAVVHAQLAQRVPVRASRSVVRRAAVPVARKVVRRAAPAPRAGMQVVVAYARAQVGKRYVHGASGPGAFDCSGLVSAAYRRVRIRLPHSSRAIAARARAVPRSQARAGDIVVGPGHVGVFVGRRAGGYWMVDAGNTRVGVTYRRMYAGLHVETLARR